MWTVNETINDLDFYLKAYEWYTNMPGCLKALQDLTGRYTKKEFVTVFDNGKVFRGDEAGVPKVLVHAEAHNDWSVEGHLLCDSTASIELCVATISFAKIEVLKTWGQVVCHVLRRHRSLVEIVERAGFVDSGMHAWQGVYRGRPQEVVYYVAERN